MVKGPTKEELQNELHATRHECASLNERLRALANASQRLSTEHDKLLEIIQKQASALADLAMKIEV